MPLVCQLKCYFYVPFFLSMSFGQKFIQLCLMMVILIFCANSNNTNQIWKKKIRLFSKMYPVAATSTEKKNEKATSKEICAKKSWHSIISDWIYSIVIAIAIAQYGIEGDLMSVNGSHLYKKEVFHRPKSYQNSTHHHTHTIRF